MNVNPKAARMPIKDIQVGQTFRLNDYFCMKVAFQDNIHCPNCAATFLDGSTQENYAIIFGLGEIQSLKPETIVELIECEVNEI